MEREGRKKEGYFISVPYQHFISFKYEELVLATNGFSNQNLLGRGGVGSVFKGILADGRQVAVKKSGGEQGVREFRSEVEWLSRLHHWNLVTLEGYCVSEEGRLLLLDFMPNNSLHFHLHGEGRPVMDWNARVKIAVGAARGIAYLHECCYTRIIHGDIKSSNILLDSNFEARVSDFGLAMNENAHITKRGYIAPEYAASGKVTEKSYTYSFRVLLLELITGRKPVDPSQPDDEGIVTWARPLLSNVVKTKEPGGLPDPRLNGRFDGIQMLGLIKAARLCVRNSTLKRPSMGMVARYFDDMIDPDLDNVMKDEDSPTTLTSEELRVLRKMAFQNQDSSNGFYEMESGSSSSSKQVEQTERRDELPVIMNINEFYPDCYANSSLHCF